MAGAAVFGEEVNSEWILGIVFILIGMYLLHSKSSSSPPSSLSTATVTESKSDVVDENRNTVRRKPVTRSDKQKHK